MPSWHQMKAGIPRLAHPTKWRSYNPRGHLSVMTFDSREACMTYCEKTGDVPVAPDQPDQAQGGQPWTS